MAKKRLRDSMAFGVIVGIPLALVYLFFYTTPIWGFASVYDSRFQSFRQDPADQIPLSGAFFAGAFVLLVIHLVRWAVKGRTWSGFYAVQAGMAVVLGLASLFNAAEKGMSHDAAGWEMWVLPTVASVVLGAIFLGLLAASRGRVVTPATE